MNLVPPASSKQRVTKTFDHIPTVDEVLLLIKDSGGEPLHDTRDIVLCSGTEVVDNCRLRSLLHGIKSSKDEVTLQVRCQIQAGDVSQLVRLGGRTPIVKFWIAGLSVRTSIWQSQGRDWAHQSVA